MVTGIALDLACVHDVLARCHPPTCETLHAECSARAGLDGAAQIAWSELSAITSLSLSARTSSKHPELVSVASLSDDRIVAWAAFADELGYPDLIAHCSDLVWVRRPILNGVVDERERARIAASAYVESGCQLARSGHLTEALVRFRRASRLASIINDEELRSHVAACEAAATSPHGP